MSALLELRAVACCRGERRLFGGLSAQVGAGRLLRLQGANGAGKTSLLRMICGLAAPAQGEIHWRGRPIARQREAFQQELLYLGHAPALKDELSALENLRAAALLAGAPCSESDARQALAQAGLRGREHLPTRLLSQGQRKRAGLARLALARDATLWVLDEPFSAVDDAACGWLQGLIETRLGRGGIVVLTSHERRGWDAGLPQLTIDLDAVPAPHEGGPRSMGGTAGSAPESVARGSDKPLPARIDEPITRLIAEAEPVATPIAEATA